MMNTTYLGEDLIFIISQPRSGSTLLQRILFGHPDIQTSAETWLMLHPVYGLRSSGITAEYDSRFARECVNEFLQNYTRGPEVYLDAIREWARVIYQDAMQKHGKRYFVDKTPRYFFIIPELYQLFPKARFIFLLRNPLAVLASELKTYVKGDWPILGVFNADLVSAPKRILNGIQLIGEKGTVIHYEEFVTEPETTIRSLCDYLGLEFHEAMLDYSNTPKPVGRFNDPVGIDQHTRPDNGGTDKWKTMVTDDQSLHFAQNYLACLGPDIMSRLGYDYQDVYKVLHSRSPSTVGLYPWAIAIQPKALWTRRQEFVSDLYFNKREKGRVIGMFSTLWNYVRKVGRAMRRALSNPEAKLLIEEIECSKIPP